MENHVCVMTASPERVENIIKWLQIKISNLQLLDAIDPKDNIGGNDMAFLRELHHIFALASKPLNFEAPTFDATAEVRAQALTKQRTGEGNAKS